MKKLMALATAVGTGIASALYDGVMTELHVVDWYKAIFIAVFTLCLMLLQQSLSGKTAK
ncbi:hypothetical protein HSX11_13285 [Oxalobacteraceae bacterium]|nr:hypothetical protein [Oxalobacteraceae bacterium]